MAHKVEVKLMRVKKDSGIARPVSTWGFAWSKAPADGFVVLSNVQGASPIFISEEDIKSAKKNGESTLRGWGDEDNFTGDEAV